MGPTYDMYAHVNGKDYQKCYVPFKVYWPEHYLLNEFHITKDNQPNLILNTDFQVDWHDTYAVVIIYKPRERCRLKFVTWFTDDYSVYFDSVYDVNVCNTTEQMPSQEAFSFIDFLIKERNLAHHMLANYARLLESVRTLR